MKIRLPRGVLRETIVMALDSVRAHKFRSFLTVLGIVIGVFTAIVIASILTGLRQNIIAIIEEYVHQQGARHSGSSCGIVQAGYKPNIRPYTEKRLLIEAY